MSYSCECNFLDLVFEYLFWLKCLESKKVQEMKVWTKNFLRKTCLSPCVRLEWDRDKKINKLSTSTKKIFWSQILFYFAFALHLFMFMRRLKKAFIIILIAMAFIMAIKFIWWLSIMLPFQHNNKKRNGWSKKCFWCVWDTLFYNTDSGRHLCTSRKRS